METPSRRKALTRETLEALMESLYNSHGEVGRVTFREDVTPWLPLRLPELRIELGSVPALLVAC
jgi:hypothetical protein